jgi:hypothetical protein
MKARYQPGTEVRPTLADGLHGYSCELRIANSQQAGAAFATTAPALT